MPKQVNLDEVLEALAEAPEKIADKEIGTTGLQIFSGLIDEEFLPQLKGRLRVEVYREMADNDPVIGAILFAIENLVKGVDWHVSPKSDDPQALQAYEIVDYSLAHMDGRWSDFISEAFSMLIFGFSVFEQVWEIDEGKVWLKRLSPRAQETIYRWDMDRSGRVIGVEQIPPSGQAVYIPAWKLVLFRTVARKGNPEGKSILRNCYRPWFLKKRMEEIEAIGTERDLAGLPVCYVPREWLAKIRDADGSEKANPHSAVVDELKKILRNIRRGEQEGIVLPSIFSDDGKRLLELMLLASGGSRQIDLSKVIDRYDSRIAMSVLADFILLGHVQHGSFALSSSKTHLFASAIGGWLKSVRDTIQEQVIDRLVVLNGIDEEHAPILSFSDIESPDIEEFAKSIATLLTSGALTPDESVENLARRILNLPLVVPKE
jgi:hypothetical protein